MNYHRADHEDYTHFEKENIMKEENETYLDDGVYASFDGWQITLRRPHPIGNHRIYIDQVVFRALNKFVQEKWPEVYNQTQIMEKERDDAITRAENAEAALEDIPLMQKAVRTSRAQEKHWKERFLEQKMLAEGHHRLAIKAEAELAAADERIEEYQKERDENEGFICDLFALAGIEVVDGDIVTVNDVVREIREPIRLRAEKAEAERYALAKYLGNRDKKNCPPHPSNQCYLNITSQLCSPYNNNAQGTDCWLRWAAQEAAGEME